MDTAHSFPTRQHTCASTYTDIHTPLTIARNRDTKQKLYMNEGIVWQFLPDEHGIDAKHVVDNAWGQSTSWVWRLRLMDCWSQQATQQNRRYRISRVSYQSTTAMGRVGM